MKEIAIIGGDKRLVFLKKLLLEDGYSVRRYPAGESTVFSLEEMVERADAVICPVPFTKDKTNVFCPDAPSSVSIAALLQCLRPHHTLFGGNLPKQVVAFCAQNQVAAVDVMEDEAVSVKNAVATAEGTIAHAISHSNRNLHESRCLVTGYGRCAKVLAQKLKAMDACVTVACRASEARAWAWADGFAALPLQELQTCPAGIQPYDFIFNTIPAPVLSEALVECMKQTAVVIDIASAPGGTDFAACEARGISAYLCLGLPGIYAPLTSAQILYEAIAKYL